MFIVYVPETEIPLSTTAEVIALLRRYPFELELDYFTIGRRDTEYLEIFHDEEDDQYSLAYIAPEKDEAQPLADRLTFPLLERIVAAFCHGDSDWMTLPTARPPIAHAPVAASSRADRSEPWRGPQIDEHTVADDFHLSAPPVQPEAYGCAPVPLLLVAAALGLFGYLVYWLVFSG